MKARTYMVPCIQKIYQARTLEEVNKIIENVLDKMQEEKKEEVKENRLVRMAKELVYETMYVEICFYHKR